LYDDCKERDLPSVTPWQSLPVTLRVWLFEICKKKQYKDIPYIYMHTPYDFCIFRI
jgi:hypothetical protein